MSTLEHPGNIAATPVSLDPLFQLQLRVARRADELACGRASARERDVQVWCEAEREIFAAESAEATERFGAVG